MLTLFLAVLFSIAGYFFLTVSPESISMMGILQVLGVSVLNFVIVLHSLNSKGYNIDLRRMITSFFMLFIFYFASIKYAAYVFGYWYAYLWGIGLAILIVLLKIICNIRIRNISYMHCILAFGSVFIEIYFPNKNLTTLVLLVTIMTISIYILPATKNNGSGVKGIRGRLKSFILEDDDS